jgi:hypothetical protein
VGLEWMTDRDAVLSPEFFSEADAIELPELSWRDVESLAGETGEEITAQRPAPEETEEQQEKQTPEWRVRQKSYAELDAQLDCVCLDDILFAVTPTMAKEVRAFRSVVTMYFTIRSRSLVSIARYSGEPSGTKKLYKPNRHDFVCDVEMRAKKALTPILFRLFDKIILQELGERWADVPAKVRNKIESAVGTAYDKAHMMRYFS